MPKQWELTVDGRHGNLATIADFVIKAAQASALNEKATFEVQLAVDEACTNIIEHGYGEEKNGEIALCCECAEGDFVVTIRDNGKGLPVGKDSRPAPVRKLIDRAAVLDGALHVESSPGKGTLLRLAVKRVNLVVNKAAAA